MPPSAAVPTCLTLQGVPAPTFGADVLLLPDGSWLGAFLAYPATSDLNASKPLLYAFKSSDAADWRFASVVAERVPDSEEGPSENALTLLANGSVLVVFRTDGGDGKPCAARCRVQAAVATGWRRTPPRSPTTAARAGFRRARCPPPSPAARSRWAPSVLGCSRSRAARCCWRAAVGERRGRLRVAEPRRRRRDLGGARRELLAQRARECDGQGDERDALRSARVSFDAGVNNSQWPRETTGYTSLLPTAAGGAVAVRAVAPPPR